MAAGNIYTLGKKALQNAFFVQIVIKSSPHTNNTLITFPNHTYYLTKDP